jgi:guanyl-specific ribonuclease Sa
VKNNRTTLSSILIIIAFVAIYFFGDRLGLTNQNGPSPSPSQQTSSQQTGSSNQASESSSTTSSSTTSSSTTSSNTIDDSLVMQNIKVYDLDGNLAYEGDVDLAPVFDRIERGERDSHDNDGSVFSNREGSLPKKPKGYYHEYVVPSLRSVGPQRLILVENGEAYYTSDHYDTFTQVR